MQCLWVHAAALEGHSLPERCTRLCIGVGKTAAAAALGRELAITRPDAVIGIGLCGAFPAEHGGDEGLAIGDACVVVEEVLADEGVEAPAGFLDLSALGLGGIAPLFADASLVDRVLRKLPGVPRVRGATVSSCSGTDERSRTIAARSRAQIETMEGAAIAFACAQAGVPWVQLRAVSNRTGHRDRAGWDRDRALVALSAAVAQLVALWGDR
jgi:futalosine hydrolase